MEAKIKLRQLLSEILTEKLNRNSFSMISKIIFESFGIFPDDIDDIEDSFNKWILNELMFLAVTGGRYSLECLKFQEEILCSSSVRRPTFFIKAAEHYLDFLTLLLNHKDNNDDDGFVVPAAEYQFLIEPTKNLKKFNNNIEFKKLPLRPSLYNCILNMCKSAVVIGIQICPKVFQEAKRQVFDIINKTNELSIQIVGLDFLNTLLENSDASFENTNIATHLCHVVKSIGENIQKYKKLDIVKDGELNHFMEVHRHFYTNKLWKGETTHHVSEILASAVDDSLNPLYESKDIDYVFDFICKLYDIPGQIMISAQRLKQFYDHRCVKANHLLVQHLALALDSSEDKLKDSLKLLNFNFKGEDLDGYFEKVLLFKMVKRVFINLQQRKDFKMKRTWIAQKSYSIPTDLFFGNCELFVLKFISYAKTSNDYAKVLKMLSIVFEEEAFYKYLFPGNLSTIVNTFHQAFQSNNTHMIKAASICNINGFPHAAKKQLQQMLPTLEDSKFTEHFVLNGWISEYNKHLKPNCLLLNDGVSIFEHGDEIVILCRKCSHESFDYKFEELLFEKRAILRNLVKLTFPSLPKDAIMENIKLFSKHSSLSSVEDQLENIDLNIFLVRSILERSTDTFSRELVLKLGKFLLSEVKKSLLTQAPKEYQLEIAETICLISKISTVPDNMFANYLKMLFFYVMSSDSKITPEAEKLVQDMCMNREINIQLMFSVHRMNLLEIIVMLAVNEYSRNRRKLGTSMKSLSKIFKSSSCSEFICINIQYITAMIVPYTVRNSQSLELLNEVSRIRNKDLKYILKQSFLKIYVYVSLNEPEEIAKKSIKFVESETSMSLFDLLHMDIKKTVDEILIWFHMNYNFVIRSFGVLLNVNVKKTNDIKNYISERFLGVLTSFESLLIREITEMFLKTEMILSLGEIIRFIGSESIALFKFKIITMLTTISMMKDATLQEHSLEAWNIFLHNIDIESVGPSLGRIVAGMEPLLQNKRLVLKVNTILKFLINSHENLLGKYIPDVFFIEKLENVSSEVKNFVSTTTKNIMKNKNVFDQLMFYNKQITDENIFVGKYSLEYLKDFIKVHKQELCSEDQYDRHLYNQMVLNLFNMICAKSYDPKMKVITSQCLGEVGAMESCYLFGSTINVEKSTNNGFSFSIHTDSFATLALKELCRAMQFLKDTKYMDNFSLAIQEIFNDRGVQPKENKKIDIWNSIPDKMKSIVEPFLTSFYSGLPKTVQPYNQIVFNKNMFSCHEDWALKWSSKLIEFINTEETKSLLQAFEPAMKRDSSILKLFLPYILLHVLHECSDIQMEMISEELKFIFNQAAKDISLHDINFESNKSCVKSIDLKYKQKSSDEADFMIIKCAKLCFELIEFLEKWKVEYLSLYGIKSQENEKYLKIHNFVECFDKFVLAKANYNCGEFTRSLQYMELFIGNSQIKLEENMSFMIQLYAELGDSDCLEGAVTLKQTDLDIKQQLLLNTLTDEISNIPVSYAQIMNYDLRNDDLTEKNINHLIESYSRIETPDNVLLVIDTLWKQFNTSFPDKYFNEHRAEPLWKLGRFEELDSLLNDDPTLKSSKNWGIKCGNSLMLLQNNDETQFFEAINNVRLDIVKSIEHISGNAYDAFNYQRLYKDFIKLHQITEIEQTKHIIDEIYKSSSEETALVPINSFLENWKLRLKAISPTLRSMEPVLNLRRSLLAELSRVSNSKGFKNIQENIKNEIGELYIQTIQLYRKSGWFQQCQIAILKAEEYSHRKLFIEKAKLHWCKGDQSFTFKILEKNISELKEKAQAAASQTDDRLIFAEAKFLIASYNAESMNICADLNIQYFKEAVNANKKSEKCFLHYAQYLDKLYSKMSKDTRDSQQGLDSLLQVMLYYARSMSYGCEFMFQSMPRLLSVWLDFQPNSSELHANVLTKMCKMIEQCSSTLPLFIFYSAFSQIISRICHPSNEVYQVLKTIIINLLLAYPQQSLWMISQVFKSTYSNRQKRCIEIYKDKRLEDPVIQKLIRDFNTLADLLIELTNKEIAKTNTHPKVSQLVPRLPKLFQNSDFSKILLPFEQVMQITLPGIDYRRSPAKSHDPFPNKGVHICGIRDEIVELQSLIKPRKVIVKCDDGKEYTIMMKPKDDLRKDFRLMEFNGLVKQCLSKNEQARLRNLHIRTYSVMPLNEECGLIEWVHNLETLRGIVKHLHKLSGQGMDNRELKKHDSHHNDPIESKREKFTKYLIPRHPPLFYQWFTNTFNTPQSWYQAKTAYIRTLAVMSTVGFILGLGDRHGENILLDKSTGHAVHVDFNCLFNLGESYQYAEKVPFRLTHSMVHAMGPLGVEGGFRKCCEITMGILRSEMPVLMSVLRPFVYDPLVTWNKSGNNNPNSERTDSKAMANLKRIEERLEGYVKVKGKSSNIPLSVDGQVNYIIKEATDVDNLASMFIGWGSYL